ncbi:MAG UNVERIFIED_CONTAM: hypothetical protein LOD86_18775, partial [Thermobifida fusca]
MTPNMPARFSDLFANDCEVDAVPEAASVYSSWRLAVLPEDETHLPPGFATAGAGAHPLIRAIGKAWWKLRGCPDDRYRYMLFPKTHSSRTTRADARHIDLEYGRIPQPIRDAYVPLFARIAVRPEIVERLDAWAAEVGEYYNQLDGEYGGLWRRNGRPPQELCGVGFTAQGNFVGSYYRGLPEASDPRVSWILEGITDEKIGDFGLSGHGAAGFELDRTDKRLGTPRHAIVIARSENHPPEAPWVLVPEEQLTHITTIPGEPPQQLIHADMTFFETPGGGAVFSTGSITFCGCLPV